MLEITKELLVGLYIDQRWTTGQIARHVNCGTSTVTRLRKKWGIPTQDRFESWIGRRFGRLVVQGEHRGGKGIPVLCICLCDCGESTQVIRGNLPQTRSCGCLKREQMSLAPGEANRNGVLYDYKLSAKRKGRVWCLSDDTVFTLFSQDCTYCGCPPTRIRHTPGSNGAFTFNGIDRVDNSQGYTPTNVAPCCRVCNVAKRCLTVEAFLHHVARIKGMLHYSPGVVDDPTTPEKCRVSQYRCNARNRTQPFTLTTMASTHMFRSPCVYCGVEPAKGIDQVVAGLGYNTENCVPCCTTCNRMKWDQPAHEFLTWARKVTETSFRRRTGYGSDPH